MRYELSWRDAEAGRAVFMREGMLAEAPEVLSENGWDGFELVTTERAAVDAPDLVAAASAVRHAAAGQVPDVAAALLSGMGIGEGGAEAEAGAPPLVALGGGRVVDAAKAVAAVRGGRVAAIPTTLSGAELTGIHRLPAGHEGSSLVRAELILADPELMTSAPEPRLRESAMNALAHGADSLYTPRADGFTRGAGLRGAGMIASALDAGDGRDPSELALGAILCGHSVDRAGLAIQHVLSQTVVRVTGVSHAGAYAALLPRTMELMRDRAPERITELADAIGCEPEAIGARLEELMGGRRSLGEMGAGEDQIGEVIETAMARPELDAMTPGETTARDLERVLRSAWWRPRP